MKTHRQRTHDILTMICVLMVLCALTACGAPADMQEVMKDTTVRQAITKYEKTCDELTYRDTKTNRNSTYISPEMRQTLKQATMGMTGILQQHQESIAALKEAWEAANGDPDDLIRLRRRLQEQSNARAIERLEGESNER